MSATVAIVLGTVAVLVLSAILADAARAAAAPAVYTVRPGDNLTLIAQRFGTDVSSLRRDNRLASDLIRIGQSLTLEEPFAQGTASGPWTRPVRRPGPVLRPFGPYKAGGILMPSTGVELGCPTGTRLYAPSHGVVRFSGPLDGYGHLLIIQHAEGYTSVLAPCDPASLEVGVGDAVLRGDPLGRTNSPPTGDAEPYVHLELRRHDNAVAPDRLHR